MFPDCTVMHYDSHKSGLIALMSHVNHMKSGVWRTKPKKIPSEYFPLSSEYTASTEYIQKFKSLQEISITFKSRIQDCTHIHPCSLTQINYEYRGMSVEEK